MNSDDGFAADAAALGATLQSIEARIRATCRAPITSFKQRVISSIDDPSELARIAEDFEVSVAAPLTTFRQLSVAAWRDASADVRNGCRDAERSLVSCLHNGGEEVAWVRTKIFYSAMCTAHKFVDFGSPSQSDAQCLEGLLRKYAAMLATADEELRKSTALLIDRLVVQC